MDYWEYTLLLSFRLFTGFKIIVGNITFIYKKQSQNCRSFGNQLFFCFCWPLTTLVKLAILLELNRFNEWMNGLIRFVDLTFVVNKDCFFLFRIVILMMSLSFGKKKILDKIKLIFFRSYWLAIDLFVCFVFFHQMSITATF